MHFICRSIWLNRIPFTVSLAWSSYFTYGYLVQVPVGVCDRDNAERVSRSATAALK
jgi:hypothetical protein